jgi:transposase-like protein
MMIILMITRNIAVERVTLVLRIQRYLGSKCDKERAILTKASVNVLSLVDKCWDSTSNLVMSTSCHSILQRLQLGYPQSSQGNHILHVYHKLIPV